MRFLRRARRHPEEEAAAEAARRSKAESEQLRAEAAAVAAAGEREFRRVRQLRVDNHLGYYLVEFARKGDT